MADDNFYPVSFEDLAQARRRADPTRLAQLQALRDERMELMAQFPRLPDDLVFYTQITMEAAEDGEFLDAMRQAHIRGALVGVESVTVAGLKDMYKRFNLAGDALVERSALSGDHDIHVLGSFIFGLPSDAPGTFDATVALAERANLTFAQFVLLTPFPGTVDFEKWAALESNRGGGRGDSDHPPLADSQASAAEALSPHPLMSLEDIRRGTQSAWDRFYGWRKVWDAPGVSRR